MNFKTYLAYAKSHPVLKGTLEKRSERYLPFFRLGERLKQKVKEALPSMGADEKDLPLYIPFLKDGPNGVTKNQTKNLRDILEKDHGSWPYEKKDENKVLQTFWYCYSNHKSPRSFVDKSFVKLDILNIISKYVGFTDFDDFVRVDFSSSNSFTILMVPLKPHDERAVLVLNEVWWGVHEGLKTKNGDVRVLYAIEPTIRALENLTETDARELGRDYKVDLVVWGRRLISNKYVLNCLAVNPVWEMHHGCWSHDFFSGDVADSDAEVKIKLKHTCYWCLFNRSFFGREYQDSYDYLIRALDLGVESFEIPMRAAVIKDILEETHFAKKLYLKMLLLLEIEVAQEQLEKLMDPVRIAGQVNNGPGVNFGDFVKRDDIKLDGSVSEAQKSMFFEMVRLKLFFLFKDKLNPKAYERVLEKIITHAKTEWLSEEYRNLLAKAHFDMGKLLHEKFFKNTHQDIDACYDHFELAVLHSKEELIHLDCFRFLKDTTRMEPLKSRIKKVHGLKKEILRIYGLN